MNTLTSIDRTSQTSRTNKGRLKTIPALLGIMALAFAFFAAANTSLAQQPLPQPGPLPLPVFETVYVGHENYTGQWTKLTFVFEPNGSVSMTGVNNIGGQATYTGSWSKQGNQMTLQFQTIGNTFQGTVNGNTIQGQGYDNNGPPWSFSVKKVN